MEADGIVAGFTKSVPLHGINVHKKLIESLPYGPDFLVEKIECRNHNLGNYANRLRELSLSKNVGAVQQRSKIIQNILRLGSDILNGPYHVFGDHTHFPERGYFCNGPKPEESSEVPAMKETGIFTEIQSALNRVAHHTNSLIEDVNNCVEQLNSLVAKTIGGKRINFNMRQSFQVTSPGVFTKKHIAHNRSSTKLRQRRKKSVAKISLKYSSTGSDEHYKPHAAEPLPDTPDDKLAVLK
ncbi:hypothetical protein PR048_009821 [Dryococelus australis]|uniref:Uncharacterized protein n=1 Tax=Dryococelus australis TaxID=614101 RepID=A0ABQ9I111_9NEOP|nr:hypothetical protein PR048_009821 [Dryococelus australis]